MRIGLLYYDSGISVGRDKTRPFLMFTICGAHGFPLLPVRGCVLLNVRGVVTGRIGEIRITCVKR